MARNPVRTPDMVRKEIKLARLTARLTYRQLSVVEPYSGIPPGTLCAIANGYPIPKKWHHQLGLRLFIPAPVCFRCGQVHVTKRCTARSDEYRDLFAMPPDELRWRLDHREELEG